MITKDEADKAKSTLDAYRNQLAEQNRLERDRLVADAVSFAIGPGGKFTDAFVVHKRAEDLKNGVGRGMSDAEARAYYSRLFAHYVSEVCCALKVGPDRILSVAVGE